MKNSILLENHFLSGALEALIGAIVDHYNCRRCHESLGNFTPAGAYYERGQTILQTRERIKRETINQRRLLHRKAAAKNETPDGPEPPLDQATNFPKIPDD